MSLAGPTAVRTAGARARRLGRMGPPQTVGEESPHIIAPGWIEYRVG